MSTRSSKTVVNAPRIITPSVIIPSAAITSIVATTPVEIPGNWHRVLDARRRERPLILQRPGDNPLHQIAAIVATLGEAADAFADFAHREQWPAWTTKLADFFAIVADTAATRLLVLAGRLDDRLGPEWDRDLDLPTMRYVKPPPSYDCRPRHVPGASAILRPLPATLPDSSAKNALEAARSVRNALSRSKPRASNRQQL